MAAIAIMPASEVSPNCGILKAAAKRENRNRLRALNPDVVPESAYGDVGYVVPEIEPHRDANHAFAWLILGIIAIFVAFGILFVCATYVFAHDDGRYAASPLKPWYDAQKNRNGLSCCSMADGAPLEPQDWGIINDTGGVHYWVKIDNESYLVLDEAVIDGENKAHVAVVWYTRDPALKIRCFI